MPLSRQWTVSLEWTAATICLAALWIAVLTNLSGFWRVSPQYAFGWIIPFIATYLLLQRWHDRPPPAPFGRHWALLAAAFLAVPITLSWIAAQPNPDWRLPSWLLAAAVAFFTLSVIHYCGGRRWTVHFAFPTLLILAAIPWPSALETHVVQSLMHMVAGVTVGLLNFTGIPALQHGNLIEVSSGTLGVDEACSGVRSLQASLAAALCLGEFYRLRPLPRVILCVAAFPIAIVFNIGRAYLLAWTAARKGADAVSGLHDPAGFTILSLSLATLWMLILFFRPHQPAFIPAPGVHVPARLPLAFIAGTGLWILLAAGATEFWFRTQRPAETVRWALEWPRSAMDFKTTELPAVAREQLRCDVAHSARWQDSDGAKWMFHLLQWLPDDPAGRILARMHRPEICLPAAGSTLEIERPAVRLSVAGHELSFRAYTFQMNGRPLHVFYTLWEETEHPSPQPFDPDNSIHKARIRAVFAGQRSLGQQIIQVAIGGVDDFAEARKVLERRLPDLLKPVPASAHSPTPAVDFPL